MQKALSASVFSTHENSYVGQELLFNNVNLCICIFKHFYKCEHFAVYETRVCFK